MLKKTSIILILKKEHLYKYIDKHEENSKTEIFKTRIIQFI